MANQVTVSNDHSINVTIEPPANVQVEISRAVIGTVANVPSANFANFAGNVTASNQPNITTIGTLSNLNVTNTITTNNIVITGNLQVGNLVANSANFANFANVAFNVTGSNVTGAVANATFANSANTSNSATIAASANSVSVANVSVICNIATINLDGNLSNILYGNGIFAAVPNVSNVANANYANFAGEAFSVSASNIVGTVNLANFATTANAVAGANVSGAVANATYADTSGSATTAGTVTTNAQPNITSVGTLTGLVVSGNITPNANITYDLGNNTNRFKDLYLAGNSIILGAQTISANATGITVSGNLSGDASGLSNIVGANVTGQVGNALVASTVYTNAQPNITSVGTLTSANVSGDALVAGNLTVGGNISYVNVNNLVVQDPVIELGGGPNGAPLTTNDGKDRGTLLHYYTTAPIDAFMGWDNGNGEFAFGSNVTNNTDVMTFNTLGNVRAQTYIGNLTGIASSATVANSANAVAGANVSGAVSFATTANSVAVANVSGIGNIATVNLDGNVSNLLTGSGTFVAIPTVSSNANYANFAGQVVDNTQSNITAVGNLPYLQVSDSANADGVIQQFASNAFAVVSNFSNLATYKLTTQYHPNNSLSYPAERTIRSRGNATTPTTAVTNDRIYQKSGLVYNGTTNVAAVNEVMTAVGTVNANANAVWTGGQYTLSTGNPSGDVANSSAGSPINVLTFTNSGTLSITPGTAPNTSLGQSTSSIVVTNYGSSTANLVQVGGLNFNRARGNRDSQTNVAAGDQVGRSVFIAYSNGAYQSSNIAQYRVNVESTYVANDVIVPMSHNFVTVANVANVATFLTTSFNSNGLANFPGNIVTTGTANLGALNVANVSNLGNVGNVIITGGTANYVLSTNGSGNLDWVAQSGGGGTPGGSNTELQFNNNGTFGGISTVTWNGSNISLGAVGNVKVTGGVNNEVMRTDGTGNLSFSSIAQNLLVGTRAGPYTVPITNYTFQVTTRTSGNVTVYVN